MGKGFPNSHKPEDTTYQKLLRETNEKIKQLAREATVIQQKQVSVKEILRRTYNSEDIKKIILNDAYCKKVIK